MGNRTFKFCIIFILILIIFSTIIVTLTNASLIDDASNFLLNALSSYSDGQKWYLEDNSMWRARMSTMFFLFLPLNVAHGLFQISDFKILTHVYSCTLFILPIISCFYSIFLLYRAKKQHYMFFPLLLLSIGFFPVFAYGCVECHFATFCFLILFLYFLLDLKFKWYDYTIFLILSISAINLHEMIVIVSPLLAYTYFKYSKNKNLLVKFGIILILVSTLLHFVYAYTPFGPQILELNAIDSALQCLYFGLLLSKKNINFFLFLYIVSTINLLFIFFSNNKKNIVMISLGTLFITLILFPNMFLFLYKSYRFMTAYFLILTMFFILKSWNNDNLYSTKIFEKSIPFLLVSFIISSLYIWTYCQQQYTFSKQIIKSAKEGAFYFDDKIEEYKNNKFYTYNILISNNHLSIPSYSIIALSSFKENDNTSGLLIAENSQKNHMKYCNERIYVEGSALNIKIKTEYWDLTKIKPHIREICEE